MAITIVGSRWKGQERTGPRYRKWAPKATYLASARISDLVALRKELFLCSACLWHLPWGWRRRWEYTALPGYHGAGHCDGCGGYVRADIYLPEEDERGYAQQWRRMESAERAAAEAGTIASMQWR